MAGDRRSLALACPLGLARVGFEQESKIPLFIAVKTRFVGGAKGPRTIHRSPSKSRKTAGKTESYYCNNMFYCCKNVRTITVINACLITGINACLFAVINACLITVINACLIIVINALLL